MSRRDNDILIEDILDSSSKISKYTAGMTFENFTEDDKTVDAVIRNFEIIGEAANNLSDDFKDLHPQIDWHKIRGFRNRIVHDYAGVDLNIVWVIITDFLPGMIDEIRKI
jgi:uncharacterized protein with HEPN domain